MKYKLLNAKTVYISRQGSVPRMETMYQIQAAKAIPRHGVEVGQLGGYVSASGVLSHQGDCWIADNAKVYGNVRVLDNALVSEEARVVTSDPKLEIIISGNAVIRGNAFVSQISLPQGVKTSLISGDADISGYVNLNSPCVIEGKVKLYDNAIFGKNCSVLNNAHVGGEAQVGEHTVIAGDSRVFGNAVVGVQCEILGQSVLAGDALIPDGQKLLNHVEPDYEEEDLWAEEDWDDEEEEFIPKQGYFHSVTPVAKPALTKTGTSQGSIYTELFAEVKEKYDAYHNDVVNLLRYPVMSDMTNDFTLAMVTAMRRAERSLRASDETEIKEAVLSFEERFLAAESNARKIAATLFSSEERKHTETATQLFAVAVNDASAENEKKNALRRAFKELEGIMDIPDTAKSAIIARSGLLELEA